MDIESILDNGNKEEVTAFLSYLIAILNPDNYQFNYTNKFINISKIDENIQNGPKSYLNPVCIEVAEKLIEKNIFVIHSFRFHNYMYLLLDKLSTENMKIFKNKYKENKLNYFLNFEKTDFFGIRINNCNIKTYKQISNEFIKFSSDFEMQDIQRGYLNEKNFLMNICNCEKVEGIKEFKNSNAQIVFDVKKMDKSFREYLKDSGYEQYYLQDEHRVYLNDFYFNAHQKYLNEFSWKGK